ncbi:MAG: KaiC domain-containing protein [Halobacteriaceae archaeon]
MADETDDWFDQALREGSDAGEDGESTDSDDGDGDAADGGDSDATVDGGDDDGAAAGEPFADEDGAVDDAIAGGSDDAPAESDGDLFEDDFASAFEDAEAPGGVGGFDGGDAQFGGPGESFEETEFESDIPRIDMGIEGLDDMIQGGVPQRSLIVAIGGAGTGKTTFGLQFLNRALENDEKAVYITLEESRERIVDTACEKGWDFETYLAADQLAIVDLDPVEMANSLSSIGDELPTLVEEFGATRLVLDSVSLLEMMYDDQGVRRTEIYDFTKSLKRAGVTTFLTSEASDDNPFASRFGIIEYLTDAVFVLRYIRPEDFRETRLAVEIQKIRDANHSRETKPYEITNGGLSVYRQANIF